MKGSALGVAALVGLTACNAVPDEFRCTSSAQCTRAGSAGQCEANGLCSGADPACASGRSYVAAGDRDGECVASPSLCPTFTGRACEGFESASVGSSWTIYTPNASYAPDPARSERGSASGHFQLQASTPAGQTYGELGMTPIPTTGMVATRAFFYFPSTPAYSDSRLISIRQTQGSFQHVALGFKSGKLFLHSSVTGTERDSTIDLPTGRWICLELDVTFGTPGAIRSYLDGQEITALRLDETTATTPPIDDLGLGIAVDDPGMVVPAYDYWMDEVAMDVAPIGCDR